MLILHQQKFDGVTVGLIAAFGAALTVVCVAAPAVMPWSFVALAGAGLVILIAVKWDATVLAWLWVLSFGLLAWPEWTIVIPGFFNMSVPRFIFVGAVIGFLLSFLLYRPEALRNLWLPTAMVVLAAYCAASATATGWTARVPLVTTAPYFRFFGGLLLPFVMFFLVATSVRGEKQIARGLILLTIYGWFALYIGYLQYAAIMGAAGARDLIWPPYVNDPSFGIHFDRARGAFAGAPTQAVFLILLFFTDLYLMRHIHGPYRYLLGMQALLAVPGLFFTGMRSAYVAFILCGVLWFVWADRTRMGGMKLLTAAGVLLLGVGVFWSNLAQTRRQTGGVADLPPVLARLVLLAQTWDIIRDRPVVGVGFGHFVDIQQGLSRDPASLAGRSSGVIAQHNVFLSMAAETGVIGLAITVAVFWLVFWESLKLYRKVPRVSRGLLNKALVVLFWVHLANYLTDATFRDCLWDPFSNALFWTFAGLIVGLNRLVGSPAADLPPAQALPDPPEA